MSRSAMTTLARAAAVALLLLAGPAGLRVAGAAPEPELSDPNITRAVQRECDHDPAVPLGKIDVSTEAGVVTLTGTVDNILARDRAVRISEMVRGVRSVVDRIRVQPPEARSDEQVRGDVEAALLVDPAADSYDVSVEVRHGEVTLTGRVQSWQERELCATVAKGVRGVTGVTNSIEVDYDAVRPDGEIRLDVLGALRWSNLVDDALIDVSVQDGHVTLSGIVGSAAEKRRARIEAWAAGVKSVDTSDLRVERWARDEDLRADKYLAVDDPQVEEALRKAFHQDPRVQSFEVEPTVVGGRVTLRGTVDNLMAKRAAADDASNTVGVLSVDNRLRVEPEVINTDSAIERAIRLALARDPFVWSFDVGVAVENGVVHLTGEVDSFFDRAQAERLASGIAGVVDVDNDLGVTSYARSFHPLVDGSSFRDFEPGEPDELASFVAASDKQDAELARDIESQLWWSPFVDADQVNVEVEDGIAVLTGTVDTWGERGAARDNAYDAGAILVRNRIEVE